MYWGQLPQKHSIRATGALVMSEGGAFPMLATLSDGVVIAAWESNGSISLRRKIREFKLRFVVMETLLGDGFPSFVKLAHTPDNYHVLGAG